MPALPDPAAPVRERPPVSGPEAVRDQPAARQARRSAVERLAADRAKYVRALPGSGRDPPSEGSGPGVPAGQRCDPAVAARAPVPVVRRAIARKPLRPDSLVIYRQKCEFVRAPGVHGPRGGLVKKLFQAPGKDRAPGPSETPGQGSGETAPSKPYPAATSPAPAPPASASSPEAAPSGAPAGCPVAQAASPGLELRAARRRGLQRSLSDLSSRCFSGAKAECDTFFRYCGLDPEVVEALGKDNFSAGSDRVALKVRSVSVATSDSGFSRHSDGSYDGLQEEELVEQVPSTTSVVERNARIIKWLYTCKKAKETSSQGPA